MPKLDKIWNPYGRKHFRRTYDLGEVHYGAAIVVGLVAIAGWVAYKGAHPDPGLFEDPQSLLDPGEQGTTRGPLPLALGPEGWTERGLRVFTADNLYEKINGRAGFFTSRGFEKLTFVTLEGEGRTIDLEFFDMGAPENALGAYGGERPEDSVVHQDEGATWHIERNALFLAKNRYYARLIGSEESPAMAEALTQVQSQLSQGLAASDRPWAHTLFEAMGIACESISYTKKNAFSFSFGERVYSTVLDDETELFATATDEAALAEQYIEGFVSLGSKEMIDGHPWAKDRYLGAYSSAGFENGVVFGVRGAPDADAAIRSWALVEQAVRQLGPTRVDTLSTPTEEEEM